MNASSRPTRSIVLLLIVAVATAALSGCFSGAINRLNSQVDVVLDSFDRAINSLNRQSDNWQVTLTELQENLVDAAQETVRVEITNLIRTSVLSAGAELRCDADYVARRLERELRRIRNDVAREINQTRGPRNPIDLLAEIPVTPVICSAVPQAIVTSLDVERRAILDVYGFDLRAEPISAQVLQADGQRRDVSHGLAIISDYQMVLDLTAVGAAIAPTDRKVIFSWNRADQSSVAVVTPYVPGELACTTREQTIHPDPHTIIPVHQSSGDQDFDGNGPCVNLSWNRMSVLPGSRLDMLFFMTAQECDENGQFESDYTQAIATRTLTLFEADPSTRIIEVLDVNTNGAHGYRDTDHEPDHFNVGGNAIVDSLRYIGDTSGDESGTRTRVDIGFRSFRVRLETCVPRS